MVLNKGQKVVFAQHYDVTVQLTDDVTFWVGFVITSSCYPQRDSRSLLMWLMSSWVIDSIWEVAVTLTANVKSVNPCIQMNSRARFKEISSRCTWEIVFTGIWQTDQQWKKQTGRYSKLVNQKYTTKNCLRMFPKWIPVSAVHKTVNA